MDKEWVTLKSGSQNFPFTANAIRVMICRLKKQGKPLPDWLRPSPLGRRWLVNKRWLAEALAKGGGK